MLETFHLREATAKDSFLLARLHAETFPENPWDADWFKNALLPPPVRAFLMEVAAEPIGFAVLSIVAQQAEILTIGIVPSQQQNGAGSALLARLQEIARRGAAEKLFLEVAEDNAGALALYGRAGFREIGRRPKYYANGQDALVLAKDL